MAATYVQIEIDEMHEFLINKGFIQLPKVSGEEIVYSRFIGKKKAACLNVFTSIVVDKAREVGEDAIRLVIKVASKDRKKMSCSSFKQRTNRTTNWKTNLGERIDSIVESYVDGPDCLICKDNMVQRKGQTGPFWGCIQFPVCKGTFTGDPKDKPKETPTPLPYMAKTVVTPDCPICSKPMVLRRNPKTQSNFYGCVGYPDCRGVLPITNQEGNNNV